MNKDKFIRFLNKLNEYSDAFTKSFLGELVKPRSPPSRIVRQRTQNSSRSIEPISALLKPELKVIVIRQKLPEKCPYCGARIDPTGIRGAMYICPYCKHTTFIDIFVEKL